MLQDERWKLLIYLVAMQVGLVTDSDRMAGAMDHQADQGDSAPIQFEKGITIYCHGLGVFASYNL